MLSITRHTNKNGWANNSDVYDNGDFYGSGGASEIRGVTKILIPNKDGELVPCGYQFWHASGDAGVGSGYWYVQSGKAIDPKKLTVIQRESFRSKNIEGEDLDAFIVGLMNHQPPAGIAFIKYDGVEEVTSSQQKYVHHFSLCGIDEGGISSAHNGNDSAVFIDAELRKKEMADKKYNMRYVSDFFTYISAGFFIFAAVLSLGGKAGVFEAVMLGLIFTMFTFGRHN